MTYDASSSTGRRPAVPHWPDFTFVLSVRWFAISIGVLVNTDAYGLTLSWGAPPRSEYGPRHRYSRSWVWLTGEQVFPHG